SEAEQVHARIKEEQASLTKTQDALTRAEIEADRHQTHLAQIKADLAALGVTGEASVDNENETRDLPALERRCRALKAQLESLGPVNPNSVKEFEAVTERHAFLETQMKDLEDAQE